ncbi:MAG: gamma-glutamyl-gamma-aminobutyrate hydrolase family protein [Nitrososphaerota archaeon]|nr:gamma-glutamyl-gamma-aminobutyrate hydrolase family protein [Nitrososphaerota archaeon]
MPEVLVVNNYPTRDKATHLESCLEGNGAKVTSIEWDKASASKFDSHDGVVLSGSPDMMTEEKTQSKFESEAKSILDSRVPILGVCFGHQLMSHAFGGRVVRDKQHVEGMVKTTVLNEDPLFEGLPQSLMLLESRYEVVEAVPGGFVHLARSASSDVAAIKNERRLLYGVQFHPERYTIENPAGNRVVGNFVGLLRR